MRHRVGGTAGVYVTGTELSALRRGIVGDGPLLQLAWGVMTGDGAAVFREAVAESCCALSEKER